MDRLGLHGTIYAGDCTGRIACPAAVVPVKLPPILESGGGRKEEGGSGRSASRNSGVRDPNGTDREPIETFEPAESTASPHRPSGKQEERYVQFLLAFTRTHRIDLVIPLIDLDVWVLSRYREAFARQGTSGGAGSSCRDTGSLSRRWRGASPGQSACWRRESYTSRSL